jgi:outer membrane lipoprotein SlyB
MATTRPSLLRPIVIAAALVASFPLLANTAVSYGKITAVKSVKVENSSAQTAGALIGGVLGLVSGRGHSGSSKVLSTVGGGIAGQQVAKLASTKQAFEYTILVGGATTTVVTDGQVCVSATASPSSAGLIQTSDSWRIPSAYRKPSHCPQLPGRRMPVLQPRTKC